MHRGRQGGGAALIVVAGRAADGGKVAVRIEVVPELSERPISLIGTLTPPVSETPAFRAVSAGSFQLVIAPVKILQ